VVFPLSSPRVARWQVGKDRDGRPLSGGGANITATVVTCKGDLVKAEVTDLNSGKWMVRVVRSLYGFGFGFQAACFRWRASPPHRP
jgi:hypothetical protein